MSNLLNAKERAEAEAKALANSLVTRYKKEHAAYPHLDSICIDMIVDYPEDATLNRAAAILHNLYRIEGHPWKSTDGRAGCIWVTPKFPIS